MPTMTVTITNVPGFAAVGSGYTFTGNVNLPQEISGPIRVNSMSLYYGYARTYVVGPYLNATCGDTRFRTDYFTISETGESSLKERTLNVFVDSMTVGTDHLLRKNGRTITFTVEGKESSKGYTIDRPRGGDMTLTVNYTLLFEPSKFTIPSEVRFGEDLSVSITANSLNGSYSHTVKLVIGSHNISGSLTGPGTVKLRIPKDSAWLSELPNSVSGRATVTLTTAGAGQTEATTQNVSLLVPDDIVPAVAGVSVVRVDGRVPSAWGIYLKGESSAKLTIEGASPGLGSSIAKYRIEGGGFAADESTLLTGKLVSAGTVTFTATVTDTRGRSGTAVISIDVTDYALPSLSGLTIERCDEFGVAADDGVYLKGSADYDFTRVADNAVGFRVYVNGVLVTPVKDNSIGSYTFMLDGSYDTVKSYSVKVAVYDAVNVGSDTPASLTERVPTATVSIDSVWDEAVEDYGVSFGQYSQTAKRLSIPDDWKYYRGEVDIEQLIEEAKENVEKLGGKAPEYYLQPYNLLDNSDFRNPVNQRGGTSYGSSSVKKTYTIDRWASWSTGESITTINDGSISVNSGCELCQCIALEKVKLNTPYTFAAMKTDGTISVIVGVSGQNGENDNFKIEWEGAASVGFGVYLKSGEYVWAALYEGEYTAETLPPYVPKGYAVELTACMRYFQKGERMWTTGVSGLNVPGRTFMSPMRIAPTIKIFDVDGIDGQYAIWNSSGIKKVTATSLPSNKTGIYYIGPTLSLDYLVGYGYEASADL